MRLAVPLLCLLLASCGRSGPKIIAVVGATLIDGTSNPPLRDATVIVEGSTIRAAGAITAVAIPKDAIIEQAAGKLIIANAHPVVPGEQASFSLFVAGPSGKPGRLVKEMAAGKWVESKQ